MNFLEVLLNFPIDEQVRKFCKPGQEETCRYLVVGRGRLWECSKFADSGYGNDSIARAWSDNCPGLLGFLLDNQDRLKGRTVEYAGRDGLLRGIFKTMEVEKGMLHIFWKAEGKENNSSYELKDLRISVSRWKVNFDINSLGAIGRTTVFLSW